MEKKDSDLRKGTGMGIGIAIGMVCGVAIGIAMDEIAIGIAIGAGIGVSIGVALESRNRESDHEQKESHENRKTIVIILISGIAILSLLYFLFLR